VKSLIGREAPKESLVGIILAAVSLITTLNETRATSAAESSYRDK